MREAIRKLKDPNLHLRKMSELTADEAKTMDTAWHEMQIAFGIPKSECQIKYASPNIVMLDESDRSRGFGGKEARSVQQSVMLVYKIAGAWWFGTNPKTAEKIERLTIQQYATRLQPVSSLGFAGKTGKKILLSKAEVRTCSSSVCFLQCNAFVVRSAPG